MSRAHVAAVSTAGVLVKSRAAYRALPSALCGDGTGNALAMLAVPLGLIACVLIWCVCRKNARRRRATRNAMKALDATTPATRKRQKSVSDCNSVQGAVDNLEAAQSAATSLKAVLAAKKYLKNQSLVKIEKVDSNRNVKP